MLRIRQGYSSVHKSSVCGAVMRLRTKPHPDPPHLPFLLPFLNFFLKKNSRKASPKVFPCISGGHANKHNLSSSVHHKWRGISKKMKFAL